MAMSGDEGPPPLPYVPMPLALVLDEDITAGAKMLWAALYMVQQTGDGGPFEMTVKQMMSVAGGSNKSVIARKKELVDAGWLAETALRGLGLANVYEVLIPGQDVPAGAEPQ